MAEKSCQLPSRDYLRKKLLPHKGQEWRESWTKEVTDKLLVLPIALLGLVPASLIPLAIKLDDGGPIFYKDRRVGKNGQEIFVYKFRSMKIGNDATPESLLYYQGFDNDNDSRLTKVGRFIRQIDIDEFPQVIQILLGQLALVEFRAIEQNAIDNLENAMSEPNFKKWLTKKLIGKQGVYDPSIGKINNPRSDLEKIPFQLDYAENASLIKDLEIYMFINMSILKKITKKIKNGIKKKAVLQT